MHTPRCTRACTRARERRHARAQLLGEGGPSHPLTIPLTPDVLTESAYQACRTISLLVPSTRLYRCSLRVRSPTFSPTQPRRRDNPLARRNSREADCAGSLAWCCAGITGSVCAGKGVYKSARNRGSVESAKQGAATATYTPWGMSCEALLAPETGLVRSWATVVRM
eukprot:6210189-Pleurochrysis_carterae.AAC.1